MEESNLNGKDLIIKKIRLDAEIKANSTLEEGNNRAKEIIDDAIHNADIYKERFLQESFKERDEIVKRRITVANLEAKKLILQAKKEIIDKAFENAKKALIEDKKAYKEIITSMLKYAEDGDKITICESDSKLITNKFVKETTGKDVTINKEYGNFVGGIIITGENSDKNLTLDVELKAVREQIETEIAEMLFGE